MVKTLFNNETMLLPEPIRQAANTYLPAFLETGDSTLLSEYAVNIAHAFDAGGSFEQVFTGTAEEIRKHQIGLVDSFEKNVRLLIEKTWVEKSEEELKADILYRIHSFCRSMQSEPSSVDYSALLPECIAVLKDVVLLLFGYHVTSESFLEYAVRIDPDFGLFWYYIECLMAHPPLSMEKSRLAIFLGIYFLANF